MFYTIQRIITVKAETLVNQNTNVEVLVAHAVKYNDVFLRYDSFRSHFGVYTKKELVQLYPNRKIFNHTTIKAAKALGAINELRFTIKKQGEVAFNGVEGEVSRNFREGFNSVTICRPNASIDDLKIDIETVELILDNILYKIDPNSLTFNIKKFDLFLDSSSYRIDQHTITYLGQVSTESEIK